MFVHTYPVPFFCDGLPPSLLLPGSCYLTRPPIGHALLLSRGPFKLDEAGDPEKKTELGDVRRPKTKGPDI